MIPCKRSCKLMYLLNENSFYFFMFVYLKFLLHSTKISLRNTCLFNFILYSIHLYYFCTDKMTFSFVSSYLQLLLPCAFLIYVALFLFPIMQFTTTYSSKITGYFSLALCILYTDIYVLLFCRLFDQQTKNNLNF